MRLRQPSIKFPAMQTSTQLRESGRSNVLNRHGQTTCSTRDRCYGSRSLLRFADSTVLGKELHTNPLNSPKRAYATIPIGAPPSTRRMTTNGWYRPSIRHSDWSPRPAPDSRMAGCNSRRQRTFRRSMVILLPTEVLLVTLPSASTHGPPSRPNTECGRSRPAFEYPNPADSMRLLGGENPHRGSGQHYT
jgi:hypothetical protein